MADGRISKITLPDGNTYEIKDANMILDSEYVAANQEVILTVSSPDE
jgi:hypothetical protein